jgi:hypothetical protein
MVRINTVVLFVVALIAVAVMATAAYFRGTPQSAPAVGATNPVMANVAPPAVSAMPVALHSLHPSDQTLRARLDLAYEHHQNTVIRTLLQTLNGRYEHRVGLPR